MELLRIPIRISRRVKKLGYKVNSETDTEVIVHLLDHEIKTQAENLTPLEAFSRPS